MTFCWVCIIMTFIFFSVAQTKLPNYIYLIFPFLSMILADWLLRNKEKPLSIIMPLILFCGVLIAVGQNLNIYAVDNESQNLIKWTFIVLSIPSIAFLIGFKFKKSMDWIMLLYTGLSFFTIIWLTYVIFPRVSHFDDIKKAANVILKDTPSGDFSMVHFYGMQPSLLVRLNKNVMQTRSPKDLERKLSNTKKTYVLSKKDRLTLLENLKYKAKNKWSVGDSVVLKFEQ